MKRAEGRKAHQRWAGEQSERPKICLSASELFSARPERVKSRIRPSVERVRPTKINSLGEQENEGSKVS